MRARPGPGGRTLSLSIATRKRVRKSQMRPQHVAQAPGGRRMHPGGLVPLSKRNPVDGCAKAAVMPGQTRPGRAAAILVQSSSGRPHCQVLQTFPLIDGCFLRASSRSPCLRGKGPPRAQDPPTGAKIWTEVPERLQKHSKSRPGALQEATKTHREEPKQPCKPNEFNKSAS